MGSLIAADRDLFEDAALELDVESYAEAPAGVGAIPLSHPRSKSHCALSVGMSGFEAAAIPAVAVDGIPDATPLVTPRT